MRGNHLARTLSLGVALVLGTQPLAKTAHAEEKPPSLEAKPGTRSPMAQALFEEGRAAMVQENYDLASRKLAESQALEPQPGTLLNLAVCHELQGRTATAWAEYKDVVSLATQQGDDDRKRTAEARLSELTPRLSYLTVAVPLAAPIPELEVRLDDVLIGAGAWGTELPIDPGEHVLSAAAPRYTPWRQTIKVPAERLRVHVTMPDLTPQPAQPPAQPAQRPAEQAHPEAQSGTVRTAAFATAGFSLAAFGAGAYFGVRSYNSWAERNQHCPGGRCDAIAVQAYSDAKTFAHFADAAVLLGVAAGGVATYLFIVDSRSRTGTKVGVNAGTAHLMLEVSGSLN